MSNFDADKGYEFDLKIPNEVIKAWRLDDGSFEVNDLFYEKISSKLTIENGMGTINVKLDPLGSLILKIIE